MFNWSDSAAAADIYIDLGTANTLVAVRGKGLIVNEPSVIAFREDSWGEREVIAVGAEAKEKIGRTPGSLVASYPLRDGVIADYSVTETMLKYYLARPGIKRRWGKSRMVISLPYGVTDVEKQAVIRAGRTAGAQEVFLIDEPIAAAIGAGLPIESPRASMIIDIGGGTTEIAIIALCGIVHCQAVRIGGHKFDEAIINYFKKERNLSIGEQTAEKLKIRLGSATLEDQPLVDSVSGLECSTGLPKSIEVSSNEIYRALDPSLREIVTAIQSAFESTPPESLSDIIDQGILLSGGGALLRRLPERLTQETDLHVSLSETPLTTIALGGARVLERPDLLRRIQLSPHNH